MTAPCPGVPVALIEPPCLSAIFRQIARPIPAPGRSERLCSLLNGLNISSRYFASNPMPLSATAMITDLPSAAGSELIRISNARPFEWNYNALPIRFWKSCRICEALASIVGRAPTVIFAFSSSMAGARSCKIAGIFRSRLMVSFSIGPDATCE